MHKPKDKPRNIDILMIQSSNLKINIVFTTERLRIIFSCIKNHNRTKHRTEFMRYTKFLNLGKKPSYTAIHVTQRKFQDKNNMTCLKFVNDRLNKKEVASNTIPTHIYNRPPNRRQ